MRGVLFDLDGTLLDLDLEAFLTRYFQALRVVAAEMSGEERADSVMQAIQSSVGAMMRPHPGSTNRDVFFDEFRARTDIDLATHWDPFQRFYEERFPELSDSAAPAPGARRAVETALGLGLRVAVATNPIFPRIAVDHRLAWAGLGDLGVDVVTTYESMESCKPHPEYFLQTARLLDLAPAQCLMVGDDRHLDLPAADVGMRTYYVGCDDAPATYTGSMEELAELLPRLAER